MKILIDGHMIGQNEGGNERYAKNLIIHLSRFSELTVLLYKPYTFNIPKINHIIFPSNDIFRILFIPLFMIVNGYDTLHSSYLLPLWKPLNKKYSVAIHDLGFRRSPFLYSFKDRLLFSLLVPYSLWLCDNIIVPSNFIKSEFESYFPQYVHKVSVINYGIDLAFKRPLSSKKRKIIKTNYFLCISSKNSRKNINFIVDAFLKTQLTNTYLYIIGNNIPNYPPLTANRSVLYLGYVSDSKLKDLYSNAKALIYMSAYEGFGLPIVEALAQNCPVIASDTPCHREIGGKMIHYIKLNDGKKLSQMIKKSDVTRKLKFWRLEVIKKYDWSKTAKLFYSLIKK